MAKLDADYFEGLMDRLRAGSEPGFVRCDLDDSFPAAVRNGDERLKAFIL